MINHVALPNADPFSQSVKSVVKKFRFPIPAVAVPFSWSRLHHTGEIAPRDTRQRRLLHGSGDVLDVARIDRGRRQDPNQCRRLADARGRYLHELKNGGNRRRPQTVSLA